MGMGIIGLDDDEEMRKPSILDGTWKCFVSELMLVSAVSPIVLYMYNFVLNHYFLFLC